MFYTVYKITNRINNKTYIGKHQTRNLDDEYMGSGKLVKRAINKYGKENFSKEILFVFKTEQEANNKEKELVVVSENTYNLCPGGHGGFGYINENNLCTRSKTGNCGFRVLPKEFNIEQSRKAGLLNVKNKTGFFKYENRAFFKGKKHKELSKKIIGSKNSIHQQGPKNSQYGTCWITNGIENKKIKKEDLIPIGFYKGRV